MSASAVPVRFAGRNYIIEFSLVLALYAATAGLRPWLLAHAASAPLRQAAMLAPILPVWLMLIVVWRYYARIDECEQKRFLETLGLSFGIASCAMVSYAFLADAGLPRLAITWAWPTLAASWLLTSGIRSIAER
jgi:hypothetical protein